LLQSRSGIHNVDNVVNHLVRNVVQIGLFATLWAIGGLATWCLAPRVTVNAIFDMTSGSIYTHVSGGYFLPKHFTGKVFIVQMIFDGLLSRRRLRERLNEQSLVDLASSLQVQYLA
jgi:hypothetical protein